MLRWPVYQNPHNHQVAAVFDFTVRLASHPFSLYLLGDSSGNLLFCNLKSIDCRQALVTV